MKKWLITLATILMITPGVESKDTPVEVGLVQWGRDLDGALKKSSETGRPVLVLFQEVPGCSGCQSLTK